MMTLLRRIGILALSLSVCTALHAAPPKGCVRVDLQGEVTAGQEWHTAIGEGWLFRLLPIHPSQSPAGEVWSGWDLVMDRETPTGFPDALLLATPPFNSINERELGTTFGLRAQDAIGWNPRSFRFLTSPAALEEGRKLFLSLKTAPGKAPAAGDAKALQRLLELQARSASGQLKILDAHIVPGVGDAAPWAQQWALAAMRTPHSNETATGGRSTAHGELRWIKFSLTLWLPQGWKTPRELKNAPAACAQ